MEFEFDPNKSRINLEKHGIDFEQAQDLWRDQSRVEVPARTVDEPRWMIIAAIGTQHWSAIFTMRRERVRIISVRRARMEEVELYEG